MFLDEAVLDELDKGAFDSSNKGDAARRAKLKGFVVG